MQFTFVSCVSRSITELNRKENKDIVVLPSFKRSAIIAGISKLPEAMGNSFRVFIVKKAFCDNSQSNIDNSGIPNIDAMIGTYCGVIDKDNYLFNKEDIVNAFYKEMYEHGRIEEKSFDELGVVHDKDSLGNIVSHNFGIHGESCQSAKVLSSSRQRQARKDQLFAIKLSQYDRHQEAYMLNQKNTLTMQNARRG